MSRCMSAPGPEHLCTHHPHCGLTNKLFTLITMYIDDDITVEMASTCPFSKRLFLCKQLEWTMNFRLEAFLFTIFNTLTTWPPCNQCKWRVRALMYHGWACLYTVQCWVHGGWCLASKWISHIFNITSLLLDFTRCQGGIEKKESIFAICKIFDEN